MGTKFLSSQRYESLHLLEGIGTSDLATIVKELLPVFPCGDLFIIDVIGEVSRAIGADVIEQYLVAHWHELPKHLRENLAVTLAGMPATDDAIDKIFCNPINNTRIRHLIASGYFMELKRGRSRTVLRNLINQIGHYDNEHAENTLKQFIANARKDMSNLVTAEEAIQIATKFLNDEKFQFDRQLMPRVNLVKAMPPWREDDYLAVIFFSLRPPLFEGPIVQVGIKTGEAKLFVF